MLKNRKGFTLLELIVVIVVAGILAGIAIPTFNSVKDKTNESAAVTEADAFTKTLEALGGFVNPATITTGMEDDAAGDLVSGQAYNSTTDVFTSSNGYTVEIDIVGASADTGAVAKVA